MNKERNFSPLSLRSRYSAAWSSAAMLMTTTHKEKRERERRGVAGWPAAHWERVNRLRRATLFLILKTQTLKNKSELSGIFVVDDVNKEMNLKKSRAVVSSPFFFLVLQRGCEINMYERWESSSPLDGSSSDCWFPPSVQPTAQRKSRFWASSDWQSHLAELLVVVLQNYEKRLKYVIYIYFNELRKF